MNANDVILGFDVIDDVESSHNFMMFVMMLMLYYMLSFMMMLMLYYMLLIFMMILIVYQIFNFLMMLKVVTDVCDDADAILSVDVFDEFKSILDV